MNSDERILALFNKDFAPLIGILCAGFYLHSLGLPIARNSQNPKRVNRDFFIGYLLVYTTYAVVGVMGYIGFTGTFFRTFFIESQT